MCNEILNERELPIMPSTTGNREDGVFYLEKLYRYKDPTDMEEFDEHRTIEEPKAKEMVAMKR
jgi:hypothetical protein